MLNSKRMYLILSKISPELCIKIQVTGIEIGKLNKNEKLKLSGIIKNPNALLLAKNVCLLGL